MWATLRDIKTMATQKRNSKKNKLFFGSGQSDGCVSVVFFVKERGQDSNHQPVCSYITCNESSFVFIVEVEDGQIHQPVLSFIWQEQNGPHCKIPAESDVHLHNSHCCFSTIPLAGHAQRTCCTSVHSSYLNRKTSEVQLRNRLSYVTLLWPRVLKRAAQNDVCVYIECERFTRSCPRSFKKNEKLKYSIIFWEIYIRWCKLHYCHLSLTD